MREKDVSKQGRPRNNTLTLEELMEATALHAEQLETLLRKKVLTDANVTVDLESIRFRRADVILLRYLSTNRNADPTPLDSRD